MVNKDLPDIIDDQRIFSSLKPRQVLDYLKSKGWSSIQTSPQSPNYQPMQLNKVLLLIPLKETPYIYQIEISSIVNTLSKLQKISPLDIVEAMGGSLQL